MNVTNYLLKKKSYTFISTYLLSVTTRERDPARDHPIHCQMRQTGRRVLRRIPVRYQKDVEVGARCRRTVFNGKTSNRLIDSHGS